MAVNNARRKSALVTQYTQAMGRFLQLLGEFKAMKVTYDSLPAFADGDFTDFPWLDATTFSTAIGNIDNVINRLTDGTSTVAVGACTTLEAIVEVVPR